MNCFLAISGSAYSSFLDELVMPGKLIEGHADLEKDCDNCHQSFEKDEQNSLCLDCHEKIAFDLEEKTGFHGRLTDVTKQPCKYCHTDHEGRDKDIAPLDSETFNHRLTDFQLKDSHVLLSCRQCHKKDTLYREAEASCNSCHLQDNPHEGEKFHDCTSCHNEKNWKEQKFDHSSTYFPLLGKHDEVSCNTCHINGQLLNVATECIACHGFNDIHRGSFGDKCGTCHDNKEWNVISFDHSRETDFPLRGAHEKKACNLCHVGVSTGNKLKKDCVSCHASDDEHGGRFGSDCGDCHTSSSWDRSRFDHDNAKFHLRGKHQEVLCNACHLSKNPKEAPSSCIECHRDTDRHEGKLGEQCDTCHSETGWDEKVRFDHDVTKFPLIGLHAVTPCEQCHVSMSYKDTSAACSDCHDNEDEHKGALGKQCQQCHNPNSWAAWNFDHDKETEFPLKFSHQDISCRACHKDIKSQSVTSFTCISCHQADDIHSGRFGRSCERCHEESSFKKIVAH
jgi:Zn finger protein HypA/HybF involved in hydrogenase expression